MSIDNLKILVFIGLITLLSGCGAEKPGMAKDKQQCGEIDGRIYFTKTLEVGGLSITGPSLMHWNVQFKDNQLVYRQTDTVESVEYACVDGEVVSASADKIAFNKDLSSVTITRNGGSWQYELGKMEPKYNPCAEVEGRRYAVPTDAVDRLLAPAAQITSVAFGEGQTAVYTSLSGESSEGIYDCSADAMHLHRNQSDTAPIEVSVNRHGIDITLDINGEKTILTEERDPVVCTAEYKPVCSVKPQLVQCLVAPCPSGFYQTASNRCESDRKGWLFQSDGECGELEGQPYYEPVACTKEYNPVCGAVVSTQPCGDVPCPKRVYETFGNRCMAEAARAIAVTEGECGKTEGQIVEGSLPGICTAIYDPVCGKHDENIVCITTPCPSHKYQTFGNQCNANFAQASTVFTGECGSLDGVLVDGEPPVHMVDELPTTGKTVTIVESSIDGDILTVTLGYSGCSAQHFQFFAGKSFLETNPVQAEVVFKPLVEDECEAYFTTQFHYDLLPLKAVWQSGYGNTSGEIILRGGLGSYQF